MVVSSGVERECLRLCATRRLVPTADARLVQALEGDLDWPHLLHLAARHQVLPLLADAVVAVGTSAVPRPARETLERRVEVVHARSRHLAQELLRLRCLAIATGIPMLAFKGPVLAIAIYADLRLRQFGDLDVLVEGASSARAERMLESVGYRPRRDYGYEATFVNDSIRVAVDLHRRLSPDSFPVSVSFVRLWERREVACLAGGRVETLSAEDLLIALCIEAVKDARQGKLKLGKMADIAHAARERSTRSWMQVETEARRLGVHRVVSFAIALAADVLGLPAMGPPGLRERSRRLARLRRQTAEGLFEDSHGSAMRHRGTRLHFHVRERWRDKLKPIVVYLRRLVRPNAHDRDVIALPRRLSVLYYLVRPLRLARRYGPRLLRVLRGA